jgi:hypothetical protein
MKIGIAISLYDKYDDLVTLLSIINNWKHDYYISVCCSKDELIPKIESLKGVNSVCQPRPVAQLGMHNNSKKNMYAQNIRCTESVRASCENLEKSGCGIGVHVHSDCWFLDEEKLRRIVFWMVANDYKVVTRGHGLEESFHPMRKAVFGSVDDHAMFWDISWCKERHVWEFKPEAMMYHQHGVHTQLAMVFGVKVGLDNWAYYPHSSLDVFGNPTRNLSPVNYDSVNDVIHVNCGALPNNWGKYIQDYYLSGKQTYINSILCDLIEWNYIYDWWLRKFGYSKKSLLRMSPVHKKMFFDEITISKIISNYRHRIVDYIIDRFYTIPEDAKTWYKKYGYIDELVGKENWTR